jgi:hypothetical protein
MQYYFINPNGQQTGPIEPNAFKKHRINNNTMVWCEGMSNWQPAGSIPQLTKFITKPLLNLPLLILYAIVISVLLSFVSIIIYAFIASMFDTIAGYLAIPVFVISVILILIFILKKFRHNFRNAFFLIIPFSISSVVSFIYFQHTTRYESGYCKVLKYNGKGYLNKFGMPQFPCVYDELIPINKEGYKMLDWRGEVPYRLIAKKDHYGLITFSGEEIIPFKYDKLWIWYEGETDTPLLQVNKEDMKGIYNLDGEIVLPCEYSYICEKSETTGCSKINIGGSLDDDNNVKGGKWGLIDKNGQLLVPCEYRKVSTYFNSGYIEARKEDVSDYFDFKGNYLRTEY